MKKTLKFLSCILIISLVISTLCSCGSNKYKKLADLIIKQNGNTESKSLEISECVSLSVVAEDTISLKVVTDFPDSIGLDDYYFNLYLENSKSEYIEWSLRSYNYSSYISNSYGYRADGYFKPADITTSTGSLTVFDFEFYIGFEYETSNDISQKQTFSSIAATSLQIGLEALSDFFDKNNFDYTLSDYGFENFN